MDEVENVTPQPEPPPPPKRSRGRPHKEIPKAVQDIYIGLIASGQTDTAAAAMTKIARPTWKNLYERNANFAKRVDSAKEKREGSIRVELHKSALKMVKKGHPWWAKFMIYNYDTGFDDPDKKRVDFEEMTRFADRLASTAMKFMPPERHKEFLAEIQKEINAAGD